MICERRLCERPCSWASSAIERPRVRWSRKMAWSRLEGARFFLGLRRWSDGAEVRMSLVMAGLLSSRFEVPSSKFQVPSSKLARDGSRCGQATLHGKGAWIDAKSQRREGRKDGKLSPDLFAAL